MAGLIGMAGSALGAAGAAGGAQAAGGLTGGIGDGMSLVKQNPDGGLMNADGSGKAKADPGFMEQMGAMAAQGGGGGGGGGGGMEGHRQFAMQQGVGKDMSGSANLPGLMAMLGQNPQQQRQQRPQTNMMDMMRG